MIIRPECVIGNGNNRIAEYSHVVQCCVAERSSVSRKDRSVEGEEERSGNETLRYKGFNEKSANKEHPTSHQPLLK